MATTRLPRSSGQTGSSPTNLGVHAEVGDSIEHHGIDDAQSEPTVGWSSLRAWLYEYKAAAGCARCERADPRCLVCHHDSENKRATAAQMVSDGRSRDEIETELDRCTILCANCHRKEHFEPPLANGETVDRLRQS
jgi:hypothetical protein